MINNILKKIEKANEVQKVELEKHEVDLSIIDDFTKEANRTISTGDLLKKENNEVEKKLNVYFKLKQDLENEKKSLEANLSTIQTRIEDINAGYNRTSPIYKNLVNKASDLGIDYPKNIDVVFKNIEDLLKYTKSVSPKNVKL